MCSEIKPSTHSFDKLGVWQRIRFGLTSKYHIHSMSLSKRNMFHLLVVVHMLYLDFLNCTETNKKTKTKTASFRQPGQTFGFAYHERRNAGWIAGDGNFSMKSTCSKQCNIIFKYHREHLINTKSNSLLLAVQCKFSHFKHDWHVPIQRLLTFKVVVVNGCS